MSQKENIMEANSATKRDFEETQLTKDILNAICVALEHLPDCALKMKLDNLYDKIKSEKLDVRFMARDY